MDVTFTSENLASAAAALQNVVNAQSTLPILQNVLVDARKDGSATFFASDLEAYARVTVSADVAKAGRLTIPAKVLADMARDLPAAPATLKTDGALAKLDCDEVHYQLATTPADDFPEWPEFTATTTFEVAQADLAAALNRVLVAVPTRDPRKVLLGAYFDLRPDGLRLVGTDGRKLALTTLKGISVEGVKERRAVVPHKVINELSRQLGDSGTVRIQFGERQAAFDNGRILYVTNLIEGDYPPYELVIPKDFQHAVPVPRDALALDIRRASVVQDRQENRVILDFKGDALKVCSFASEVGRFESSLRVEFNGEPIRICFNFAYLSDILKACGGDRVVMKMNKPATPAVFVAEGDDSSLFLLMPIKLTEFQAAMEARPGAAEAAEEEAEAEETEDVEA